jgi:hypothetical protein
VIGRGEGYRLRSVYSLPGSNCFLNVVYTGRLSSCQGRVAMNRRSMRGVWRQRTT